MPDFMTVSIHTVRQVSDGPVHPENVRDMVHPRIMDDIEFFVRGRHEQQSAKDLNNTDNKPSVRMVYPEATSN